MLGAAFVVMVVGGISSQASDLTPKLAQGADKIQGWLQDLGVSSDSAQQANSDAGAGLSKGFHALLTGVATGVEALASLAVFLSFTALSLFFFLKDGPVIRAWAERHLGVPRPVGHIVVSRTLQSLRGYFVGVTAVAAFNGIVIGLGALIVGVPQAGSIAVVNFAAAYIPFLGAWSRRGVHRAHRARRAGNRRGHRHDGDRPARQRRAPAARPADRDGRGARDPSPGGPGGDDRVGCAVRHRRDGRRGSAGVRGGADLRRPGREPRARGGGGGAVSDRAEPGPVVPQPGQS